jgi:hypothetical protein
MDANCQHARCEDVPELVAPCLSDESETQDFYGLQFTKVANVRGYADFLGNFGDNAVLVRGGEIVKSLSFLDAQTKFVKLVMVVHAQDNGLTSVLEIQAYMDGNSVRFPYSRPSRARSGSPRSANHSAVALCAAEKRCR